MKKITTIILLLLITLTSCSNDSNSSTPTNSSIIGKWNFSKTGFIADGIVVPDEDYAGNTPGCNKNYWQFNNTGIANLREYRSNCVETGGDKPWTQVGNILNIDLESTEVPNKFEIVSVTATELKLKGDITGFEGVTPGVNLFVILTFDKAQ